MKNETAVCCVRTNLPLLVSVGRARGVGVPLESKWDAVWILFLQLAPVPPPPTASNSLLVQRRVIFTFPFVCLFV